MRAGDLCITAWELQADLHTTLTAAMLLQCWLSKVPNLPPQQVDDRMERGSYTVFDPAQWAQVYTLAGPSLHCFGLEQFHSHPELHIMTLQHTDIVAVLLGLKVWIFDIRDVAHGCTVDLSGCK